MTVIIKCRPPLSASSAGLQIEAPLWQGASPIVGERVFVWTSETQGGSGLVASGMILNIEAVGKNTRMQIASDGRAVAVPLGKANLEPFCYSNDGTPIATLSAKLYYHAWNKIAVIDAAEEQFLDARFQN